MPEPSPTTTRRVPQPLLALAACAGVLLIVMVLALYGGLPGAGWALGVPLNLVPAVGVSALLWAAAFGLGDPLVRGLLPAGPHEPTDDLPTPTRLFAQAALGMAALLLLWWVLFWAVAVGPLTTLLPVVVGLALLGWRAAKSKRRLGSIDLGRQHWPWTLTALMPGLALLLVAASCPPGTLWRVEALGYDVTSYHLQVPKEWLALGRATPLDHNVYSFFPGLMEHGYTAIAVLFTGLGGCETRDAVYACQVFHAGFALLAAWGLVETARRYTTNVGDTSTDNSTTRRDSIPAAVVAGGAVLVLPWVVVTGSLAYNELAVLGFGAAALLLALRPSAIGWRRGAAVGLLLGAATMAKLTAGPMLVVPIAILACMPGLVARDSASDNTDIKRPNLRPRLALLAALAAAGLLTLAPYLARNTLATGNPVFPFATSVFGTGHWDDALAERWHRAHATGSDPQPGTLDTLQRQWLRNTGYGALGGTPVPPERHNIARFAHERGLPVFWLAVLTAFALMLGHPRTWRLALAMLAFVLWQLVFWRVGTHLQSRFLLFTLLPAGVVLAVGAGRLRDAAGGLRNVLPPIAAAVLMLTLLTVALTTLWHQTPVLTDQDGETIPMPVWLAVDSLRDSTDPANVFPRQPGTHPINLLPPDTLTLILGDNSTLFYIDRPIVYSSAFDANPLGEIVRATDGSPAAVNAELRALGVTHVWLGSGEIARLRATYGYDDALTPQRLIDLVRSWWPAMDPALGVPLFRVPPAGREAGHAGYNPSHTSSPG